MTRVNARVAAGGLAAVMWLVTWSDVAHACAVCFGEVEGPLATGTNMAVLAMLGVTAGVLGSFAAFFITLVRRARAAERILEGTAS